MKSLHRSRQAFTLIELLVVIAIIAILAALAVPQIASALDQGKLTQTLNNAKQVHLAATRMSLDNAVNPDPKLGWPGDITDVATIGDYVERLVEYNYFSRGDLKTIFSGPSTPIYPGTGNFTGNYSVFKIYKVKDTDVGQVIFCVTKNFDFAAELKDNINYAKKGAIVVRKGGEALKVNNTQAKTSNTGNIGIMSGKTSSDDPGTEGNALTDS